jgi:hypothetical protein
MSFQGAGGTPGGVGSFFTGIVMMCVGFYLLLQSIHVSQTFTLGASLFHLSAFGGTTGITGGMILLPLIFGIGMIFYNSRNGLGWILALGSLAALVFGVLTGLQFSLRSMSLFDLLTILVLSVGGLGLFLGSLRSQ